MNRLRMTAAGIVTIMIVTSFVAIVIPLSNVDSGGGPLPYALYRYDERRSGQAPVIGDITDPQIRWTYERPPGVLTSPIVADINDDSENEVVFGGTDGKVTALDENGNFLWEVQEKAITAAGTVGDVDGDGKQEVIVTELQHFPSGGLSIIVLNGEDGSEVWRFTPPTLTLEEGFSPSPILEDITGDGIFDILVGGMTYSYYALDGPTGAVLWTSNYEHFIRSSSPMADIDLDGRNEIVGIDNHALMKIHDAETGAVEWQGYMGYCIGATPAIGELDGDPYGEIVFSMCVDGGIMVLNHDGSLLWMVDNNDMYYASPVLIDIDGDGLEDVVNTESSKQTVYAFKGTNGAVIWEKKLPYTTWAQGSPVGLDIDGDSDLEILAGSDSGFYSLNALNGDLEWFFPTGKVRGQPFVVDLENEGGAEIVYASGSVVYVIEQRGTPPIAIIDIYMDLSVCMRVEGRKWNTVEVTFTEDGQALETLKITREPGSPNEQMVCTSLKMYDGKSYAAEFKYTSLGIGANPVKLIFANDNSLRMNMVFNSEKGLTQEKTVSLDEMLEKVKTTAGVELTFDASGSYDPDGTIVAYHWDFGDGQESYEKIATHAYASPGTYTVTLEVTDNGGAKGYATMEITVL
jgi:outer membrane protein assembly factor BamB